MMCAWKELLGILPAWLRPEVDRLGREQLQELRLRINAPPELILGGQYRLLKGTVTREDLNFCINTASRYSPWVASTSAKGYLSAPGGHRIGLCGTVVCNSGKLTGIREVHSLCIRVARDLSGIAEQIPLSCGSVLILGAPGRGKTTFLRDLSRRISKEKTVSVVDERGELFPDGLQRGRRMDVLSGCPKTEGIEMVLRTMGPDYIAVDEITSPEDCAALVRAANCGVELVATAHGTSRQDFFTRSIYRDLAALKVFQTIIILQQDKSYTVERVMQ